MNPDHLNPDHLIDEALSHLRHAMPRNSEPDFEAMNRRLLARLKSHTAAPAPQHSTPFLWIALPSLAVVIVGVCLYAASP